MQQVEQWAEDMAREARRAVFFATLKNQGGKAIICEIPPAVIYSANLAAQWKVGTDRANGRIIAAANRLGWSVTSRNVIALPEHHLRNLACEAVAFWSANGYSSTELRQVRAVPVLKHLESLPCPEWAKGGAA